MDSPCPEKFIEPDDLGWMSGTRSTLRNTGAPINTTGLTGSGAWNWRASNYGDQNPFAEDTDEYGDALGMGGGEGGAVSADALKKIDKLNENLKQKDDELVKKEEEILDLSKVTSIKVEMLKKYARTLEPGFEYDTVHYCR